MSHVMPPTLTERFVDAVALALEVHGKARRPGTGIPFTAHLFVVTGLVIEDGGDEDEAIAALLHDAVEDQGGRPMLERIRRSFGERVAAIVEACSDSIDPDDSLTWSQRKQRYLAHLRRCDDEGILRVALADKVHNARSLVRDYRQDGPPLWERFAERTPGEQLAYYGSLLSLFKARRPGPLTEDFEHAVGELAALLAADRGTDVRPGRAARTAS